MTRLWLRALDPGYANTGVADLVADDGEVVSLTTWTQTSQGAETDTPVQAVRRFGRMTRAVIPAGQAATCSLGHTHYEPVADLVLLILEGLAVHAKGRADLNSAYWHRLVSVADARGIPVAVVGPTTLKLWATGHGGATKAQMGMALARMKPGTRTKTSHDADAALLALMAASHPDVGWFVPDRPLVQAKQLGAITTWPPLGERAGVGR